MHKWLSEIDSPQDLGKLRLNELKELSDEIRDVLCGLVATRTAHFASNLGVVELCLALHTVFDFRHDRLIWDTGHQVYPHKLVTGRYHEFGTMRMNSVRGSTTKPRFPFPDAPTDQECQPPLPDALLDANEQKHSRVSAPVSRHVCERRRQKPGRALHRRQSSVSP